MSQAIADNEAYELSEQASLRGPRVDHHAPYGLPGLVREQRRRTPDAVACSDPERSLTYTELDALSDQLAEQILRATGGRRGAVALRMHRQVEVLVAFLGVLKAGCHYVPLATNEPAARVQVMLDVVRPVCCVVSRGLDPVDWDSIPAVAVPLDVEGAPRPLPAVEPDQPVYAMFTSGSSGAPKAVLLGSAAVCNRMLWMAREFDLSGSDRFLQKTAYTFDVSGWEFYMPVITGGTCVFAPVDAHHDPRAIARVIADERITICHFVPTMLEEYLRLAGARDGSSLRMVFCSGEALPAGLASRFVRGMNAELHNLYGPTETAIEVTHWAVPAELEPDGDVFIGAPIDNVDLRVLDPDARVLPPGAVGELWVGGVQVALGYVGRPELAAQAFLERDGQRWYRTGDLVQVVDGQVRYLGRTDAQVKIRGVRVEPGEIESALVGHPAIGQATVVPVDSPDGGLDLVAVAVAAGSSPVPSDHEILQYLGDRLPRAFVPRMVFWVQALPLTSSGKADRKRIGQQAAQRWAELTVLANQADQANQANQAGAEQPGQDPVADEWWRVLGTPPDRRRADVGFLNLGGHSLSAVRLLARIFEARGVDLPLSALLRDNLPLAGFSALAARTAPARPADQPAPAAGSRARSPLTPAQEPVWLVSRLLADPSGYNVVGTLRVAAALDEAALRAAIGDVIARHDVLRAGIQVRQGMPEWSYAEDVAEARLLTRSAPAGLAERGAESAVDSFVAEVASMIIDPERPPLLNVGLLRAATGDQSLLTVSLHHLVADLRTLEIVVEDLATSYAARSAGGAPHWDVPAGSFADYAHQRAATVGNPAWQQDLAYWERLLQDAPARTPLPFRLDGPAEPTLAGQRFTAELGVAVSEQIDAVLAEQGHTSAMYFLACVSTVLAGWSGEATVTVGMPVSQRQRAEQLELAGFLLSTVPLRIAVGEHPSRDALLEHVRDRYVSALEHATPTVQAIVHRLGLQPSAKDSPLFQVWVNDLSRGAPAPELAGRPSEWLDATPPAALFDLNFYLRRAAGYRLELVCGASRYDDAVAAELLRQVIVVAEAFAAGSESPFGSPGLPADRSAQPALASPDPADLAAAVRRVAEAVPDAIAISHEPTGAGWTYRDLMRRVDQVAETLVAFGTVPGDVLELRAERSPALPVALLAGWQVGAAVAITDASSPAAVLEEQCELLRPVAVLTLDDPEHLVSVGSGHPAPRRLDGISHLLFTSGTSGRPAAVAVPPAALAGPLRWYLDTFELGPADRIAMLGGLGHDPLLRDILATLLAGGRLVVPPADIFLAPDRLFELLNQHQVSVLHATPALIELILSGRPAGGRLAALRLVVSGGAPLTAGLARALRAVTPARLVNAYGTTETPQIASCHQVAGYGEPLPDGWPDSASLPVGSGAGAARLTVDRTDGSRPDGPALPVGQLGEVVIHSPYLATGYLDGTGRVGGFERAAGRYHTGDRGRLDASGAVVLDGRLDRQLAIDGHRLDPEQIERAALRHPAVHRALAQLRPTPAGDVLRLSVIPAPGASVPPAAELRGFLRQQLPRYAVPAEIHPVTEFVLNRNHKVVQARDPAAEQPGTGPSEAAGPSEATGPSQPGSLDSAGQLAELVAELVGVQLPATENFFDAGLNSMAVVRIHAVLAERLGSDFPVTAMFEHPNLTALARFLQSRASGTAEVRPHRPIEPRPRRSSGPRPGQPAAEQAHDRAQQRRQLREQIRHDSGGNHVQPRRD